VTELQLTLAACGAGLAAAPFAWRHALARPPAPLPDPRDPVRAAWPVPVAFLLLVVLQLAFGRVFQVASSDAVAARMLLAGAVGLAIAAALLLSPRLVRPAIGVPRAMGAGLLVALAAMPFVYGVLAMEGLFVDIESRQEAVEQLQRMGPGWQEKAVAAIVLAPLAAELVFRVLLYGGLRRSVGPRTALYGSAALFGLVHAAPPTTILPMAAFGLILGRLMERTGSYVACLAAHAGFNLFGVAAALST